MRFRAALTFASLIPAVSFLSIYEAGSHFTNPHHVHVRLPVSFIAEPVRIESESGATLVGSWLAGKKGMPALLLMHGVWADRGTMVDRARYFHEQGYSVLLFDFQAHGESTGERITFGYQESLDAKAALKWIRSHDPGVRIGAIGVSMGGAAAVLGSAPLDVDALVLESVYPDIEAAIGNRMHRWIGPLAFPATPLFMYQVKVRLHLSKADLSPILAIPKVHCPVLVMAGTADPSTPPNETEALFAQAPQPKELVMFEGARHENLYKYDSAKYKETVNRFFKKYLDSKK